MSNRLAPFTRTSFDPSQLPAVREHHAGCGPKPGVPAEPKSTRGRWRALVLLVVHVAIALHVWHWLARDSTLTPLEPSEIGATLTEGIVNAGAILFVLATLSTLVLGRFFCGWACHVVALQDGCAWLLKRLGLAPKPVRSRLLAFVPLLAALWMFVLPSLVQLLEGTLPTRWSVALTTTDFWARFPGPFVAALTFLTVGGLAVWLLGSKGFCTYGCPYGAIFAIADRAAPGRIRVTDACNGCGHCTAVCTSNVEVHREVAVHKMVVDSGCMKCLDCVSSCPKDALFFGFTARASKPRVEEPSPRRAKATSVASTKSYDFTWPEEIAMAVVFLATCFFAYRGLYGVVPFLLALTLAVATAIAVVIGWRLIKMPELTVQHAVLRRAGATTAAGRVALLVIALVVTFAGQSFAARWHDSSAIAALGQLRSGAASTALAEEALAHLDWLARFGLWHAPAIDLERGRLSIALGQPARAEPVLAAAARRSVEPWDANFALLRAQLDQRASDPQASMRASATLERVLDRDPSTDMARGLYGWARELESKLQTPKSVAQAALLAALAGDSEGARVRLEFLQRDHPKDEVTRVLAERLARLAR